MVPALLGGCLDSFLDKLAKISINIAPVAVPLTADGLIALGLCHPAHNVTNEALLPARW